MRLAQGDAGEAAELAERAARAAARLRAEHGVLASTLVLQSRAQLAHGDDAGAIAAQLERALDILRTSDQANSDQATDAAELLALARQRRAHPG